METNRRVSNVPSIASLVFFLSFFLFFFLFFLVHPFSSIEIQPRRRNQERDVCFLFFGGKRFTGEMNFASISNFWILATHFLDISCIWCTKSHISEARDEKRSRLTGETRRVFPYLQHICGSANTALCHSRVIFGPAMGPGEES